MKSTRPLVFILLLVLWACSQRAELVEGNGLVVLEHATIVDGTGSSPRGEGVVVLAADRILRVGRMGQYRYPGATVVDLTGRWLVPGFMDLHAHMDSEGHPQSGAFEAKRAATLLAFGITTIRSTAAPREAG